MDHADELRALTDVRLRLEEHFPELDADVVEAAVRLAHSELTGPVRDFVPVLVEHAARDRLSFALRDDAKDVGRTPPTPAMPPTAPEG